jgi:hypothetical protein
MSRYSLFLVLPLAGAALLLTGLGDREPPSPAAAAQPTPAPQAAASEESAEPAQLLDRAIAAYAPARVLWAEMKLWQRARDGDSAFEVSGRYLAAPGDRMRLDLHTQVGATRAELRLICDGQRLCQWQRLGTAAPSVLLYELPRLEAGASPAHVAWARTETVRDHGFGGVGPLLRGLRGRLRQLTAKAVRWQGVEVIRVNGVWPEDAAKLAEVPDYIRPRQVPRRCSLYLDAKTLWLHRLEWWYSERPGDTPELGMQTEFRDPVLNRPLSPQRCAAEFGIPQ